MTRATKTLLGAICATAIGMIQAAPVIAGTGSAISVPEPTDLLLFAMGVAGVAIGRRMHAKASRRDRIDADGDNSGDTGGDAEG